MGWKHALDVEMHASRVTTTQKTALETDVPKPVIALVEKATDALGNGELSAALTSLVRAWVEHPIEQLADVVETLGEATLSNEAKEALALKKVPDATWESFRKADAIADRGALMTLMSKTSIKAMCVRAKGVREHTPDPRITRTFTAWLRDMPFRALSSRAVWTEVFEYLKANPDLETQSIAKEMAESELPCGASMRKWMASRLDELLAVEVPQVGTNPELRDALQRLHEAMAAVVNSTSVKRPAITGVDTEAATVPHAAVRDVHTIAAAAVSEVRCSPGGQLVSTRLEPVGGWRARRESIISFTDRDTGAFRYSVESNVNYAVSHDATLVAYGLGCDLVVEEMTTGRQRFRTELAGPKSAFKPEFQAVRGLIFRPDDSVLYVLVKDTLGVQEPYKLITVDPSNGASEQLLPVQMPINGFVTMRWLDDNLLAMEGLWNCIVNTQTRFMHQAFRVPLRQASTRRSGFGTTFCKGPHVGTIGPEKQLRLCNPLTLYPEQVFPMSMLPQAVFETDTGAQVIVRQQQGSSQSGPLHLVRIHEGAPSEPTQLGIKVKDVRSINFDNEGQLLVGTPYGDVQVWNLDAKKGSCVKVLHPSGSTMQGVGAWEGGVFAWNLSVMVFPNDAKHNFREKDSIGCALMVGPRLYASVTSGIYARSIGAKGKKITFKKGHTYHVTGLAYANDHLVSTSGDNAVILWNLEGEVVQRYAGHSDASLDVAFHPKGEVFATVGADQTLRLWDASSPESRAVFELDYEPRRIAWSADGATIAITSSEGVHLMSPDGETQLTAKCGGASAIEAHPARPVFAVACGPRVVWVSREGWCVLSKDHSEEIQSIAFATDGNALYVSSGMKDRPGALTELALEFG